MSDEMKRWLAHIATIIAILGGLAGFYEIVVKADIENLRDDIKTAKTELRQDIGGLRGEIHHLAEEVNDNENRIVRLETKLEPTVPIE